jgi:hypothetical protein
LSVIFQSGIVKIPSDHQTRSAALCSECAWEKLGHIALICQDIMVDLVNQTRKCVAGTLIKSDNQLIL